jgi:hypothetical protein
MSKEMRNELYFFQFEREVKRDSYLIIKLNKNKSTILSYKKYFIFCGLLK